jgi:outer membrane murein-binding lipoprotein Lpp
MEPTTIMAALVGIVIGAVFILGVQGISKPKTPPAPSHVGLVQASIDQLNADILAAMHDVDMSEAKAAYSHRRLLDLNARRVALNAEMIVARDAERDAMDKYMRENS